MRALALPAPLLLLALTGSVASPASAGYPSSSGALVNDFAEVLTPQEENRLRAPLQRLRESHGIDAVLVTVPSVRAYGTGDASIESFATGLFNAWGVGNRDRDDGALVVLAVQDREVRIEVGEGWGHVYDSRFADIISERMIPRFKRGDLAGGLQAGVEALEKELAALRPVEDLRTGAPSSTQPLAAPRTVPRAVPRTAPVARSPQAASAPRRTPPPAALRLPDLDQIGEGGWLLALSLVAALVALGVLLQSLIHGLRTRCPKCRGQMARLTEEVEDQFLEAGQQTEEKIGSVGYDVLRCPSCQATKVVARSRWLSSARRCQQCRFRTVQVSARVLSHPTEWSTGEEEITEHCQHCGWHRTRSRTLPRLERREESSSWASSGRSGLVSHRGGSGSWSGANGRSSGSSSSSGSRSSFGGGRSSGGGASGKW